jgi:hypothetical protein
MRGVAVRGIVGEYSGSGEPIPKIASRGLSVCDLAPVRRQMARGVPDPAALVLDPAGDLAPHMLAELIRWPIFLNNINAE